MAMTPSTAEIDADPDLDDETGEVDLEQFTLPDALVAATGEDAQGDADAPTAQIALPEDHDIW